MLPLSSVTSTSPNASPNPNLSSVRVGSKKPGQISSLDYYSCCTSVTHHKSLIDSKTSGSQQKRKGGRIIAEKRRKVRRIGFTIEEERIWIMLQGKSGKRKFQSSFGYTSNVE